MCVSRLFGHRGFPVVGDRFRDVSCLESGFQPPKAGTFFRELFSKLIRQPFSGFVSFCSPFTVHYSTMSHITHPEEPAKHMEATSAFRSGFHLHSPLRNYNAWGVESPRPENCGLFSLTVALHDFVILRAVPQDQLSRQIGGDQQIARYLNS